MASILDFLDFSSTSCVLPRSRSRTRETRLGPRLKNRSTRRGWPPRPAGRSGTALGPGAGLCSKSCKILDMRALEWYILLRWAGIAQLVEYKLPKLGVAGSSPVARSIICTTQAPARTSRGPEADIRITGKGGFEDACLHPASAVTRRGRAPGSPEVGRFRPRAEACTLRIVNGRKTPPTRRV